MNVRSLLAAGLVAAALAPAGALAATFNLTGNALNSANEATVDGITLTAYAGLYSDRPLAGPDEDVILTADCDSVFWCDRSVRETAAGLGVDGFASGSRAIDGDGLGNELLTLVFDQVVDFTQVVFTRWNPRADTLDLFVDGLLVAPEERTGATGIFSLVGLTGTSISFGADNPDDAFYVGSITVAPVPLPATGLLLLGALGGLAALRRRAA